jgi:hypothetical protein
VILDSRRAWACQSQRGLRWRIAAQSPGTRRRSPRAAIHERKGICASSCPPPKNGSARDASRTDRRVPFSAAPDVSTPPATVWMGSAPMVGPSRRASLGKTPAVSATRCLSRERTGEIRSARKRAGRERGRRAAARKLGVGRGGGPSAPWAPRGPRAAIAPVRTAPDSTFRRLSPSVTGSTRR